MGTLLGALAAALLVCACAESDRPAAPAISFYEGPDRPGGRRMEGPASPSNYRFESLARRPAADPDLDGGTVFEFLGDAGDVVGMSEDTNHDGKADVYKKISHGVVVEVVRDRNFDGTLDVRSRDTDGDGKLDLLEPLTP